MREPKPHEQPMPGRRSGVILFVLIALALGLVGVAVYALVDRPAQGTKTPYGADYRKAPAT